VLENGEVRSDADAATVASALEPIARQAEEIEIRLGLESALPAAETLRLIDRLATANVGVCYDSGNAAFAGFDCVADISTLGRTLVGVHLKDRLRGGGSVPLGQGDVDFSAFFAALARAGYEGPVILEAPAGDAPVDNARRHLAFARRHAMAAATVLR
jgi:hexulose-6-phosphate isomerase